MNSDTSSEGTTKAECYGAKQSSHESQGAQAGQDHPWPEPQGVYYRTLHRRENAAREHVYASTTQWVRCPGKEAMTSQSGPEPSNGSCSPSE